jgi:LuxR family maltose regulon positive regulatory protein
MAVIKRNGSGAHYYSPRLRKKLEGILTAPVTVVEAPSGYGKSTAVRDYLMDSLPEGALVYWLNVVEDDLANSWVRLCRECTRIDPLTGKELLAAGFPKLMSAWEIGRILRSICCDTETVLVLDDFQYLQQALPRIFMSELLSCAVDMLHIVIITQTARPFPLSFFEQAKVHLIRTEDLRLNEEGVRQYCRMCGVAVSQSEVRLIYEYTEGWIAALYLTILQMQRGGGYSHNLGILQLMENIVWKNLGDEEKRLLLHIALFPGVTIEQIDFLLQEHGLPERVFALLEETPFIRYETGERRYVPHAILLEMLRRRLVAADAATKRHCSSGRRLVRRTGEAVHAPSRGDLEAVNTWRAGLGPCLDDPCADHGDPRYRY